MGVERKEFVLALVFLSFRIDFICGECNDDAPSISDARSNSTGSAPYPEGTAVKYECNAGFTERSKVREIVCADGKWSGKFACTEIRCGIIKPPDNGDYVTPLKQNIGDTIVFACRTGFTIDGQNTILCRSDGQWSPSNPPSCKRVNCGDFGDIEHASLIQHPIDGNANNANSYGSTIHVTCDEGYVLDGILEVKCSANGTWDEKPKCRTSPCGPHPALNSSCIQDAKLNSDGTLLITTCLPNYSNTSVTEIGEGLAFCYDGQWDDLSMGCFCDCKVTANFSKVVAVNLDSNRFLKHGLELNWKCENGFKKKTEGIFKCLDGKVGVPECILNDNVPILAAPIDNTVVIIVGGVLAILLLFILCGVGFTARNGRKISNKTAFIKEMIPLINSNSGGPVVQSESV